MTRLRSTGTILDQILAQTQADLDERRRITPQAEIEARVDPDRPRVRLSASLLEPGLGVIAEIKRGSPSKGVFPVQIDPRALATDYIAGGANGISILTDAPFFHGSLADMEAASEVAHGAAVPRPVLRKDFIVDPYQIAEAARYGADAVLLIVAALSPEALSELLNVAAQFDLEALVEVHDEEEMRIAIESGAGIIGINNRNLRTFEVDLAVSERLAPLAPAGVVTVGESGIFTAEDARRMVAAGLDAVLVGEALVLADDRGAAIHQLQSVPAVSR